MGHLVLLDNFEYPSVFCNIEDIEEVLYSEEVNELDRRLEILDQAIESVMSLCSSDEFYIISLIFKGYKKQDISKILNVSISRINRIENMFVSVLADVLSKLLERTVDVDLVEEYLEDIKKEKHFLDRIWSQWIRYRELTEAVKEEKERQKLLDEIKKYNGGNGYENKD